MLLTAPVLLFAVPFLVVGFLTRTLAGFLEPRYVRWQQLIEFDSRLGWKPRANLDTHYFAERDDIFHVTTDSEGWPGGVSLAESQLVVFGDSYAFGYGVNPHESFAECNPDLRIKAIAAPGYNLVQELLLMRQLSLQLRGKLVVWFIYVGNDLYDNLAPSMGGYRMPFVRETNGAGQWEIVTRHVTSKKWSHSHGRHRAYLQVLEALHSPTFLSRRAYGACEFLIGEAKDVCSQVGAQLVVLSIPCPLTLSQPEIARFPNPQAVDPDLPDREIGKICGAHKVPFLAAKDFLDQRDYKGHDDHWNQRGHRRVAKALGRLYQDYLSGAMEKSHAESYLPSRASQVNLRSSMKSSHSA